MAIRKINGLLPKIEKSFVSILWLKYCMTEHKSPLPPSGGQKIDLHNKLENNSLSWPSGKKQRKKEKKNEKDALYHSAWRGWRHPRVSEENGEGVGRASETGTSPVQQWPPSGQTSARKTCLWQYRRDWMRLLDWLANLRESGRNISPTGGDATRKRWLQKRQKWKS